MEVRFFTILDLHGFFTRSNADAPTDHEGNVVFAKPHEEDQDFEEFLNYVINQEKSKDTASEVRYAQTRMSFPRFQLSHHPTLILTCLHVNTFILQSQ